MNRTEWTMEREEFAELVREAVKSLPGYFRKRMDNISIIVDDYPSEEEMARTGASRGSLLGLYQGIPLRQRSVWQNRAMPDKISIYQANIEAVARTPEPIRRLVRDVVMHEIGHYFGLSEEELRRAMDEPAD